MSSAREFRLGYWAAVTATAEVAIFAVELVWYLVAPSAAADTVSYIVCLLLAPTFVTMVACTPLVSADGSRSFTRAALGLAAMYGALCALNYYLQLSVVRLGTYPAPEGSLGLLRFTNGSPAFAMDMLGYFFMCLSTLVLVPAIGGRGEGTVLKVFCAANGALAVPTVVFPALRFSQQGTGSSAAFGCVVLLAWCLVFLPIPFIYARRFRRGMQAGA